MWIENGVLRNVFLADIPEDGNFVIPDSVTSIGNYAFYECYRLTSVAIPESVTSIGERAFHGCTGLKSVVIPGSVTEIRNYAFYECTQLTLVTICNGVKSIGRHTFFGCLKLTSVSIPDSMTSIEKGAFACCPKLTSVTIGNSVTSIGDHAFSGCSGLTSITIPDSVTTIGIGAFRECSELTTVVIGNGVTRIEMCAFRGAPLKSAHKNYKAFGLSPDGSLVCLNKIYKVGKRSFVKGMLTLCENGIHYCTNLFEIFNYYYGTYGKDFVIAECEVSREQEREKGSSKKCTRWIIPQRILAREEVLKILNDGRTKKRRGNDT